MVAVRSPEVAFLVLLAENGLPGDSILKMQGRLIAQAAGTPAEVIELSARAQTRMFAAIAEGGDSAAVQARLRQIGAEVLAQLTEEQRRAAQITPASMEANIRQVSGPWFRYFLAYDPRPTLRRVRVPVLALNGSLDLQVPPKEDLAAIAAALREGGNRDVRTIEFPGLNHLFQNVDDGRAHRVRADRGDDVARGAERDLRVDPGAVRPDEVNGFVSRRAAETQRVLDCRLSLRWSSNGGRVRMMTDTAAESPLRAIQNGAGAAWTEVAGRAVARHYGDPEAEYRAVRESAGLAERGDRARIRPGGRIRWDDPGARSPTTC